MLEILFELMNVQYYYWYYYYYIILGSSSCGSGPLLILLLFYYFGKQVVWQWTVSLTPGIKVVIKLALAAPPTRRLTVSARNNHSYDYAVVSYTNSVKYWKCC